MSLVMGVKYLIMQPNYNVNHSSIIEHLARFQYFSLMNNTIINIFAPRFFFFFAFRIVPFTHNLRNLINGQNV